MIRAINQSIISLSFLQIVLLTLSYITLSWSIKQVQLLLPWLTLILNFWWRQLEQGLLWNYVTGLKVVIMEILMTGRINYRLNFRQQILTKKKVDYSWVELVFTVGATWHANQWESRESMVLTIKRDHSSCLYFSLNSFVWYFWFHLLMLLLIHWRDPTTLIHGRRALFLDLYYFKHIIQGKVIWNARINLKSLFDTWFDMIVEGILSWDSWNRDKSIETSSTDDNK